MFAMLLLLLCFILFVYFWIKTEYWKRKNVKQEKWTTFEFVFGKSSLPALYKKIYEDYPNEPFVGTYLGTTPALVLRDLENIQAVLANDFVSFHSRGIAMNPRDVLADNVLFINDYRRWKLLRQKLTPVFTTMKLKNMFYLLEKSARDFASMVKENPVMVEKPFNALYTYTTASIGASVFGIDTHTSDTMNSPFLEMAWKSVSPSIKGSFMFFMANTFPKLSNILDLRAFGEHEEFFVGFVKRVLKSRRSENVKRHDFIDMCIELQKDGAMKDLESGYKVEPTDEVLAAQAFFFFIAGADTSANTMNFTLLELSHNPDILKKVHKEIDEVFDGVEDKLTYNEIEKLQYLEMVINEAMRKYPLIGIIQRQCARDTVLPTGNFKISKGEVVVVPVFGVQRDERYYPNPEKFDPERFSPENIANIPKYAFLPFGEGGRMCLGMRFAKLQVTAGLAWLLRRFTLKHQPYSPIKLEQSPFGLRYPDANYRLVSRK